MVKCAKCETDASYYIVSTDEDLNTEVVVAAETKRYQDKLAELEERIAKLESKAN